MPPPFSQGDNITHVIASLKTTDEDGGLEIRNLIRGNDTLPIAKLRAAIDRDLFDRAPGRIPAGDIIELSQPSNAIRKRRSPPLNQTSSARLVQPALFNQICRAAIRPMPPSSSADHR
jgi:hypothetical protein